MGTLQQTQRNLQAIARPALALPVSSRDGKALLTPREAMQLLQCTKCPDLGTCADQEAAALPMRMRISQKRCFAERHEHDDPSSAGPRQVLPHDWELNKAGPTRMTDMGGVTPEVEVLWGRRCGRRSESGS